MGKICEIVFLQIAIQLALMSGPTIRSTFAQIDKPLIEVVEFFQIRPYRPTLFQNLGRVNGIRQCGGQGRVLDWRNEGCIPGYLEPFICQYPAELAYRAEILFSPKEDAEALGIRLVITGANTVKEFLAVLPNSTVRGGSKYTLTGAGKPIPELRGEIINLQFTLFRMSDKVTEICTDGDHLIY